MIRPRPCPPPSKEFEKDVVPFGQLPLTEVTSIAMVGFPSTVREGLRTFLARTGADEIMIVSHIYDHARRVRSYEIAAEVRGELSFLEPAVVHTDPMAD